MPIRISKDDGSHEEIAWLCNDDWELPTQLHALQEWLSKYEKSDIAAKAIADIGFSIRPDAFGGGAVLGTDTMRRFADAGVEIHFSEYPQDRNDEGENEETESGPGE